MELSMLKLIMTDLLMIAKEYKAHHTYILGCIEFFVCSIFIWLTLLSLYFLILRTIYFLTFFDLRPPSFAKSTFFKFKLSN